MIMDTENLKNLGWLLVWGALFFVMMRYGCGAHMMGGHGKHGKHRDPAPDGETKDPVCGMSISPGKAGATAVAEGRIYYFCSITCREKFERSPEKYVGSGLRDSSGKDGHHTS
ncbi:MAG: YHS domain-containing protein [Burkholderiales bacterium]